MYHPDLNPRIFLLDSDDSEDSEDSEESGPVSH